MKYSAPFNYLKAQKGVNHKVIEWTQVSGDEGTGFVHIAPGCGLEDFELSKHAQMLRNNDKEKLELMKKIDTLERLIARQRRRG